MKLPQKFGIKHLRSISSGIIIGLIIVLGVIGSIATGLYVDNASREDLTQRATDISLALAGDKLQSLTGTSLDLEGEAYRDIKQRLINIRQSDDALRSVYVLDIQQDSVRVLVDSEAEISPMYAAPGTIVGEASSDLKTIATSKSAFAEGPLQDTHGTWIAAYAPIVNNISGELIAVVGVEKTAEQFYLQVVGFALLPLFLIAPAILALMQDRRVRRKEQSVVQLKSKFVSVASHELRSPLSGMLWAIESLLKPSVKNLTIEQQVILLDMYQSTEESLSTINEILDMTALEKNKPQQFAAEPVELGNIIKNATKTLRLSANERGMKFAFVGNWNGDDCYTTGDRSALKRLFMNLITNAIKYGRDDTTISIRLSQKESMHVVAIEDHGIGIPESEQRKVLSGYYRASNAQKTQKPGTGLGLLLAQRVTEQHGGNLHITSREGSGTTVYVSLPITKKN